MKPYWPVDATTNSDSEDLVVMERLRVETKVNVELHLENKLNHTDEREAPKEREQPVPKDTAPPSLPNTNHQPEQRKGKIMGG